ncbi:hypothetical protein JCM30237_07270 [Halolamina litorea]|uniref:sensor histidine kinase n=1 Tax=Halolamina litorea TaxID=1515593 RepID=UPI00226DDDB9|nr:histidine kinase N-terminal 7TM domain-containing protein [Halolamina litorea]
MQFTPEVAASAGTALLTAGTAAYLYRRRQRSLPILSLVAFNVAVAVWTGGNALQAAATVLSAKLFWVNVQYVGISVLPVSIVAFGLSLSGNEDQLSRRRVALLAAPLVAVTLLSWTNGYHGLVRSSVGLVTVGGTVMLEREFGAAFWAAWLYSAALNVVGTALVIRAVAYADQVVERRVLTLLLAPLVPWTAQFLYLAGMLPVEPEVFFGVTGVAFAYAVLTWQSVDPTPARDAVFELLDEGVVVVSGDGHVVDLNGAARDLLGLGEASVVGEPVEAALAAHPDLLDAVRTGEPREDLVVEADGIGRRLDVQFTSFDNLVGPPDRITVLVDLTDVREQERTLERQNERLESFASIVSHDLRNPLSVAVGHTELARETCDSEHLAAVERAHKRMEVLIEDILTMAREGDAVDEVEPVPLAATAELAWQAVATDGAGLRVDADAVISTDRSRLQQLFENLFRNSVEHGSTGNRRGSGDRVVHDSPDAQVGTANAEAAGTRSGTSSGEEASAEAEREHLTVSVGPTADGFYVADDGEGIPEADRERVFEPGYSTGGGGTGLGLSIVAELAEAHGWTVDATESAEGGARFEFSGVGHVED